MYKEISSCRICGNEDLISVLNLGHQTLTGVFPKSRDESITAGPLELVLCGSERRNDACGLLQLRHGYDLRELYGSNYGYRSGLNISMVRHLQDTVARIVSRVPLNPGDLVVDIGSNDSTLLQAYSREKNLLRVGIDPTGLKFRKYYPDYIHLIPDFFSAEAIRKTVGNQKAKVVTSIAMFYDLEAPLEFMAGVRGILADDGIWVFEQSYMPAMLEMHAYDAVCHEHLEYYSMRQIQWMCERTGFKVVNVDLNSTNGGSFSVTAAKDTAPYPAHSATVNALLASERRKSLDTPAPYDTFREQVFRHRDELRAFVGQAESRHQKILGYGASTKGNVLLQFCGFTAADIPCIGEVNEDKFGAYTPGTLIPIVPEEEARAMKPDYFLVLPWHFKETIVDREQEYILSGGKLLFPLPHLETYP